MTQSPEALMNCWFYFHEPALGRGSGGSIAEHRVIKNRHLFDRSGLFAWLPVTYRNHCFNSLNPLCTCQAG
ncbi:MAG: hypothetical protein H6963_05355 [Chromatiaceae bacterium]|nr:hypothetical protein [Chromatiaceae bacterium]MCP5442301.1 hypothetical protein [Chromatiaceae bacterium]